MALTPSVKPGLTASPQVYAAKLFTCRWSWDSRDGKDTWRFIPRSSKVFSDISILLIKYGANTE